MMPAEGEKLRFEAWHKTQRHPIVIVADFEALLKPVQIQKGGGETMAIQAHIPMSYCIVVVASDDEPAELLERFNIPTTPIVYMGSEAEPEVARHFKNTIVDLGYKIEKLFETNEVMLITDEEEKLHFASKKCNLCNNEFGIGNQKVADHHHLSGRFRQTLCNSCNLKLQMPKFVPCFFHNLTNYDAHFIIRELGYDDKPVPIIPNSEEKFIFFSKFISNRFQIRFIDTFRFMATCLSTLAENLYTEDLSNFRQTAKVFGPDDLPYAIKKSFFPYSLITGYEKMDETCLPPIQSFLNKLTEETLTIEEYSYAQSVWSHFKCETLRDYSNLYLKIDVMLLADIVENFRGLCLQTYGLDPAYYYTSPGLSFDAMLKRTSMELELLSDYDMLLMFERGLTQASMRLAKANSRSIPDYDKNSPKSWIIYQDCNNLYGWPYGGFRWVEPTLEGLNDMDETSPIGRLYEVDITYPQHLHDRHSDLPFLPKNGLAPGSKIPKLMATLEAKKNYVIHYRNLQQAIADGLIVNKVHRAIQFKQSSWLAKYININTELRKKVNNDFEKDFFKLMNNAVFGKTMESMRKRIKMELVPGEERLQKLINKPTFKYCTPCGENLQIVSMQNRIINFCKPIYIGFAVLEISKTLMYNYHYNVMKKHYNDRIQLMYTDTDSLIYYVETEDFYDDLLKNSDLMDMMDTANLPKDNLCYIAEREKVPGLFSDECKGGTIREFIALRAKSYAYIIEKVVKGGLQVVEEIKAKGIRPHVVKHHMTFDNHKKCLFGDPQLMTKTTNVSIRSYNHHIYTIAARKLTYNNHDDKRYSLNDLIHKLPWGHHAISELINEIEDEIDVLE